MAMNYVLLLLAKLLKKKSMYLETVVLLPNIKRIL